MVFNGPFAQCHATDEGCQPTCASSCYSRCVWGHRREGILIHARTQSTQRAHTYISTHFRVFLTCSASVRDNIAQVHWHLVMLNATAIMVLYIATFGHPRTGPLHSACRRSNCRSKSALQVKWVMLWELCLIDRQGSKNAFRFKLRMFGHKELPQECAKIVVKEVVIWWRTGVRCIALVAVAIAAANQPYKRNG